MSNPAHERDPDAARERALVEKLHSRDPAALELLAGYGCRIEVILTRKFGAHIPKEEIKDIVAETLLYAFQIGPRYDPEQTRLITWLSVIAHYKALQFLRTNLLWNAQTLDQVAASLAAQSEATQVHVENEQPSLQMEALLGRLSPRRAEVIRLHYYGGLSIEQIAELLNIAPVSVRAHLCRALKDLRELTSPGGEGERP